MKLQIALISLFALLLGCQDATTIDMSSQQNQVELSEESKKEIEEIVREVVREELATMRQADNSALSNALQEARSKNEQALVEEKKKNADKLIMTCMRIASDAQAWLRKPAAFGGAVPSSGERPTSFKGLSLSLEQLGYPIDENGSYSSIEGSFEIEIQDEEGILVIYGRSEAYKNLITVKVGGPLTQDINTEILNLP